MANTYLLNQLLTSNAAPSYLRAGITNQYIGELQTLLKDLGYANELQWNTYGADGYYGQPVVNAVGTYGYRNKIATDGMSVSSQLLHHMLQAAGASRPAQPAQPARPATPSPPPAAPQRLNITDQGETLLVGNGQKQVKLFKRDNGYAFWGSITIDQAIRQTANIIKSLGITDSALNVMKSVSENEGKLDSINSYDRAFFSLGIFQWTIGIDGSTGELPALLKKYKTSFPGPFQQSLGVHGLGVSNDTTDTYGFLTLNGNKIDQPSEKEQFRKPEWAFHFWLAAQQPELQAVEIEHALSRLKAFYWNPRYAINGFTISEIITSEYGVALLLDNHVNRPSYVQPTLAQAMQKTGLNNPTMWGTAEERRLIDAYLQERVTFTTGSYNPMTKAQERAAVTRKYLQQGVISDARNSFKYTQGMVS